MAHFAILRVQKLKSAVAVHRSMKHAFREQDTPNADPERTPDNTHIGAESVSEGMAAFRSRLPEKHRKDAVLAIEYLVTGSPAAMFDKQRSGQDAYFRDALQWFKEKHGAENVVYAGIHRDETTPHMYAYVVPRVGEKLNCRQFLGGSRALSQMQTDFSDQVGIKHGLERGLEGSRARHTTIRQHYGMVLKKTPQTPRIEVPEPSVVDRLNPRAYGERVAASVLEQVKPAWQSMSAKAKEVEQARHQVKEVRETQVEQAKRLKPIADALRPLSQEDQHALAVVTSRVSKNMQATRMNEAAEKQRARGLGVFQDKGKGGLER